MLSPILVVGNKNLLVYQGERKVKELELENSVEGVNKLGEWIENNNVDTIIVVGNYEWAKPFIIALTRSYPLLKVKYYPSPKKEKGERENLKQRATSLLEKLEKGEDIVLKEYSLLEVESKKRLVLQEPETYRLSLEYIRLANQVRRIKHKIYSVIRYIAPELLEEVERYLRNDFIPNIIFDIIESRKKDRNSLTYYVYENDRDYFDERVTELKRLFSELSYFLSKKKEALEDIKERIDKNHPLIKAVIRAEGPKKKKEEGDEDKNSEEVKVKESKIKRARRKIPDSVYVLLGFIGNRPWTYKKLKTYIGLDTREKNGRRVLDRRRPEVRQYFFIVAKTTALGQEAWEWFTEKHKDNPKYQERFKKYRGTMMIEALLQYIFREKKIWQQK
jgi:hypothetical protein